MNFQSASTLRDKQVIARLNISRSAWWKGVKEGRFPAGNKISPRIRVWLSSEIDTLIEQIATGGKA